MMTFFGHSSSSQAT